MRFLTRLAAAALSLSAAGVTALRGPQTPLLHHAAGDRTVWPALFAELEQLARLVDIAYCVGQTSPGISKPFTCLSRCSDFPDFELVKTWNTGPFLSDSCGYLALDHAQKRIVVAFRGTYSVANTVVDLSTVPQKYVPYPDDGGDQAGGKKCDDCTVHRGFYSAWSSTKRVIVEDLQAQAESFPEYSLHLVGHSLGGAVAALAALDLQARGWNPTVTTFGEPRVGNAAWAEYVDHSFNLDSGPHVEDFRYRRVTHTDDPVPLLPLTEWGFTAHSGEIYISKSDLSPDIQDLKHCVGDGDKSCIAGQDSTVVEKDVSVMSEPWSIPTRYRLWQLFFSHRDYFWRLGVCLPGGDPLGGGGKYENAAKSDL